MTHPAFDIPDKYSATLPREIDRDRRRKYYYIEYTICRVDGEDWEPVHSLNTFADAYHCLKADKDGETHFITGSSVVCLWVPKHRDPDEPEYFLGGCWEHHDTGDFSAYLYESDVACRLCP